MVPEKNVKLFDLLKVFFFAIKIEKQLSCDQQNIKFIILSL